MFDHVIPLSLDERVTVIHGSNGIGKTVVLNMLDVFYFSDFLIKMGDNTIQIPKGHNTEYSLDSDYSNTDHTDFEEQLDFIWHSKPVYFIGTERLYFYKRPEKKELKQQREFLQNLGLFDKEEQILPLSTFEHIDKEKYQALSIDVSHRPFVLFKVHPCTLNDSSRQ